MNLNTALAIVGPFLVGFAMWLIQRSINNKTAHRLKLEADLAEERARIAEEKRAAIAEGHQQVLNRLAILEKQGYTDSQTLALLKQEMLPMAEAMKRKLIDLLTHPSEPYHIPDKLLEQVRKVGAPLPAELMPLLVERITSTDPHVTEQEKLAAEALPIIVKLAELEAKDSEAEITGVQLVTSTAKTTETKQSEENPVR